VTGWRLWLAIDFSPLPRHKTRTDAACSLYLHSTIRLQGVIIKHGGNLPFSRYYFNILTKISDTSLTIIIITFGQNFFLPDPLQHPLSLELSNIHYHWINSRFYCGVNKICALFGFYVAQNGNILPTFRDNLSVPLRVRQFSRHLKIVTTGCPETSVINAILRYVKPQKSADLIHHHFPIQTT
jgi:hypothetical protein